MAKSSARPRPEWEQLADSGQRIYLALAEGDLDRARQLYQHDQRPRGRRRPAGGGANATAAAKRPGRSDGGGAKATAATAAARRPRPARGAGGGANATAAARRPRPARDLRGFVDRDGRLVPPEMAAAEAWKRRQARRDSASM